MSTAEALTYIKYASPFITGIGGYLVGAMKEKKKNLREDVKEACDLVDEISVAATTYWNVGASQYPTLEDHRNHSRSLKTKIADLNSQIALIEETYIFCDVKLYSLPQQIASLRRLVTGDDFFTDNRAANPKKCAEIPQVCIDLKNDIKRSMLDMPFKKWLGKCKRFCRR